MNRGPLGQRAVRLGVALALAGPLVLAAFAEPLVATPLCGTANGTRGHAPIIGAESRKPVRVASVNLLHDLTEEGDRTLDARQELAIAQLAAADVHVVAAQEVVDGADHGPVYREMAEGLAKATGWNWHWCFFRAFPHVTGEPETRDGGGGPLSDLAAGYANANDGRWYQGGAVYSRYKIIRGEAHRLPAEDSGRLTEECVGELPDVECSLDVLFESRIAVWARIFAPRGILDVTSAHTSGTEEQHADLVEWLAATSTSVKEQVLACDCNATDGSAAIGVIRDAGWTDGYRALNRTGGSTSDQQVTNKSRTVSQRIDYAWVKTGTWKLRSSRLVLNQPGPGPLWPSDHYGVLVELAPPGT